MLANEREARQRCPTVGIGAEAAVGIRVGIGARQKPARHCSRSAARSSPFHLALESVRQHQSAQRSSRLVEQVQQLRFAAIEGDASGWLSLARVSRCASKAQMHLIRVIRNVPNETSGRLRAARILKPAGQLRGRCSCCSRGIVEWFLKGVVDERELELLPLEPVRQAI
jgi:hypothetical protein